MAEFAGNATFSAQQPAVGDDACTDSLGHADGNQVVQSVARSKPDFRQRAGVGNVIHHHRQSRGLFDMRLDVADRPIDIGGEHDLIEIGVESAGKIDSDAVERAIAMGSNHLAQRIENCSHHFFGILGKFDNLLGDNVAAKIGHGQSGLVGMNI
jgi:hypothetical protein